MKRERPVEISTADRADPLRQQPDIRWLMALDPGDRSEDGHF